MKEAEKVYVVTMTDENTEMCNAERHETMCAFRTREDAEAFIKRETDEYQREHYDEFVNGDLVWESCCAGYMSVQDGDGWYTDWLLHEIEVSDGHCATFIKTIF